MGTNLQRLKERAGEVEALRASAAILGWDQRLQMPAAAAEARGGQLSAIRKARHEKITAAELGELLSQLDNDSDIEPGSADEALIRVVRQEYERLSKVPVEFVGRFSENAAASGQAWATAKEQGDFSLVSEHLKRTLEISREFSSFFPEARHVADPIMAENDPGVTVSTLRPLFAELRRTIVPMVEDLTRKTSTGPKAPYKSGGDTAAEHALVREIIESFGFDPGRGRLDRFDAPFTIRFSADDVRLACAHLENDPEQALFSGMHESGHAIYEQGVDRAYDLNFLGKGASEGVHESQARLWENIVGRGRPFWSYFYPRLQELRPELDNMPLLDFLRHINRVQPSPIRTRADEVTYNLHIALRFDLELELLEESLDPEDLPEAWNERMQQDLGVVPANDAEGVLQDGHWFASGFVGGFFQPYAIGSVLSAQFYEAACVAHPRIPDEMERGDFSSLHGWLSAHVYRHGARYPAGELVERATGSQMTVAPLARHLQAKYAEL